MKNYIIKGFLIIFTFQNALASDYVDTLIKKEKVTESEFIAHHNETEAIKSVIDLIQKHQGKPLEATLRHRLADLYVRQSQTRNFVDQIKKHKGKDLKDVFSTLPSKTELLKKAVLELQTVEKQFPRYPDMDVVLYTMGMSYFKMAETNLAERPFLKLTKSYPKSTLLQDARLLLAEIYYFQKNYPTAIQYFTYIANDKDNKSQSYGFYKRGWAHFYLNKFTPAFNDLKTAYQVSLASKDKFDLKQESLDDMPLFAAEIFKGKQIETEFSKFIKDKNSLENVLNAQAVVFSERAAYHDEIAVLDVLYKRKKAISDQFDLGYRLAKAHENTDNLVQMSRYYKLSDKLLDKKIDQGTKDEFLVFGRNVVKQRYKEWVKGDKKFNIVPVIEVGDLAHEHIKDQLERSKFINVLADLNVDVKNYAKASHYYEMASDMTKESGLAHDLMYSSLYTLEQSIVKQKWKSDQVERQRVLVGKYRKRFPTGQHMIDILYKYARVENVHGSKKIALEVFLELGEKYASSMKGQEAQDFVVDIYNKEKNFEAINAYLEKVIPKTNNANRRNMLADVYDKSFFSMAQIEESKRNHTKAVEHYSNYLKKSVLKKNLVEAKWNIPMALEKGKKYKAAANAYVDFYRTNSNHKNAIPGLEQAFKLYEKSKDLTNMEKTALLLEQNTQGVAKQEWKFARAKVQVLSKKEKEPETLFYSLVKETSGKLNETVHQYLFDHVDKGRSGFKQASLRVLQTGKEPFKSEAFIRVGIEYLGANNVKAARAKFNEVLNSKQALAESKAKASIFVAEMDVKQLKITAPAGTLNFDQAVKYLESVMARVTPVNQRLQAVLGFNHAESSLRAYLRLARVYLDLGVVLNQVNVNDKPDLKLAIERELRNIKMTTKTSFYESYEMALNLITKDRSLKRKYNSELKKIRKEFDEFYDAQRVAVRGGQ